MPPWKYTTFIKAGRVTVPLEISFLQTPKVPESEQGTTREQMKEVRELLKPAVELALKCHNDYNGSCDKYVDHPYFASKSYTSLAYLIQANDKYGQVVDLRQSRRDDDDDEEEEEEEDETQEKEEGDADENSGLRDLGGSFCGYRATKFYIRVSVLQHVESATAEEEKKQLLKSLGVRLEPFLFFKPLNGNPDSPSPAASSKK